MTDQTPDNASGASSSPVPPSGTPANSSSGVADAPASSPGSTASPPPSSPESSTGSGEAASGEAFDFGAIFDAPPEIPASEAPVAAPPSKPKPPEPEKPPAPPPVPVEAPPAPPAPQAPKAEPTPQAAAPTEPQTASLDSFDPASLSQHLVQNEDAAIQFTAENMFKLSQAEVEALETNVVETVPKLLAKAFVKSQQSMLSQLARVVPAMIQRQTEMVRQNTENESKFYARWPDIKPAEHGALVRKYAAVYRQMHPQATLEQIVEDLGPMVMMAARVVPQVGGVPGAAASPMVRTAPSNGRSPPPPPFAPAGAGATNTSKAVELSPIEVMFQDHG